MLLSPAIFEWKAGKAKEDHFDRCLFKNRLSSDACSLRKKTEEKIVTFLLAHIILTEIDGLDYTIGEQTATLFQDFCFCLMQLDFYFYLGSCSLQTIPPSEQL